MANRIVTHPAVEPGAGAAGRLGEPDRGLLRAGITAGVVAGLVMALVAMARSWTLGLGFFLPARVIAATTYGVDALVAGGGAVAVGVLIHLAFSAFLGVVFAGLLGRRASRGGALWAGLFYGFCVWLVMTYLALPVVNPVQRARADLVPGWWLAYHLIYGAVLGLAPVLSRPAGALPEARRARIPV